MLDATVLRQAQKDRDHTLSTRVAKIREETATQNLVIRLALAAEAQPRFDCAAIFLSRDLEKRSGADLELSIRRHAKWLNLGPGNVTSLLHRAPLRCGRSRRFRIPRFNRRQDRQLLHGRATSVLRRP